MPSLKLIVFEGFNVQMPGVCVCVCGGSVEVDRCSMHHRPSHFLLMLCVCQSALEQKHLSRTQYDCQWCLSLIRHFMATTAHS